MNLTSILINVGCLILAVSILLPLYLKERKLRNQAERALEVVKEIGDLDDKIFRMKIDDPEDWPKSPEAQSLIRRRIKCHEEYSTFLGHHPLRDNAYIIGLENSIP